ncbi:galactonate dehydratase [Halostella pelagica]|uniref:galactonate dehydratase n=1 Tax=Halostella pelagica TaxID=2583824 RepID=UPI0010810FD2|nr:galactonate dehydratase [Halostella pelagica]
MKIVNYELYEVPPRWLFLEVTTSDGLVGWGEPIVEGRASTVREAVEDIFENYLLGKDASRIEDHWQAMYRGGFYRGGPILMSAIAGIDQALWDIKGKRHGLPVYELLGGPCRDRVRVFQWIGGDRPENIAEEAEQLVDTGYTVLKMDAAGLVDFIDTPSTVNRIVDRVAGVREAVGDTVDICLDFRGRISKAMSKRLVAKLEPYDLMFVEEPVLPEHNDSLSAIGNHTTTPLATGERMYSRWDFKPLLEEGAVDVVQPNLSHAGGITEVKKIADMAAAYDVAVAPNCPVGPITLASSIQMAMSVQNFLVLDHGFDIQMSSKDMAYKYLSDASVFDLEDGYIEPPDEPGIGIAIDEETIRAQSDKEISWHNMIWRHADGSIADW